MTYLGIMVNYWCGNGTCEWYATITQPIGYFLRILCPMCNEELMVVHTHGN